MYKRGLIKLSTKKYNMKIIKSKNKYRNRINVKLPGYSSIKINLLPKSTEFKKQFETKRALKSYYNLNNLDSLINLESRLDVILFRLYFVRSIDEARDFIKKGKVKVNNRVVKNSSFKVIKGSSIKVDSILTASNLYFRTLLPNFKLPSYLIIKNFNEGILVRNPTFSEFTFPKNLNIKKFYN